MQGEANVGAASGLIYYGDGRTIYSAGGIFTELWNAGGICWNNLGYECYGKDKPHYVTYADGAYTVVDAEIVRSISINGKPFFDKAFLYFDDYILGLLLWNKGYKVRYYPIEAGFHYAHKTIKPVIDYFGIRAHIALMSVVKTRFKPMASIHVLRRSAIHSVLCAKGVQKSCDVIRAIYDGILLGNYAKNRIGVLTLYKAPYFRRKFEELKCFVAGLCKESKITFKDVTYPLNGV
jgi:GT2 family glycosyltransferase